MPHSTTMNVHAALCARFPDAPEHVASDLENRALQSMVARGSCRAFASKPVAPETLEVLCAVALSSPSKSDLQQRDIIMLHDAGKRAALAALIPGQSWIDDAPMIAVFCGNNQRQRMIHDFHNVPFANDHLDAFFNATVDAALALGAFVTAAEAVGLGCCPISAVRNETSAVSDLLALPSHVFPVAGLAIGYPAVPARISKRLPLGVTCHRDRYDATNVKEAIAAYDASRGNDGSYPSQRRTDTFGTTKTYGWSDDKVRQYSLPERADFGAYVRACGFRLD